MAEEDGNSLINSNPLEIKEDVFSAFLNSNAHQPLGEFGEYILLFTFT